MRVPLDRSFAITTKFGVQDSNAFFGKHSGLDYAAPADSVVVAPANSTVWWAGFSKTGGHMLILHDGKYYHRLMHNNRLHVRQGSQVTEGQHIADSGATGLTFGAHLHWDIATEMLQELRPSAFNKFINPADWLKEDAMQISQLENTIRDMAKHIEARDARIANIEQDRLVNDSDNEFNRMNDLFIRIRGRGMSREEFRQFLVGQSWLRAVEILSDDPESAAAQRAQEVGQVALRDDWQGQIARLLQQADALAKNPTKEQLATLQQELNVCIANMDVSNEELAALKEERANNEKVSRGLFHFIADILKGLRK